MRACRMGDVAGTGRATPSRAGASAQSSTWAGRMRRGMCVGCRGRRGRRTGCRASRSGSTWRVRGRPGRIILVRACRRRRRTTGGSERCGSGRELSGECVRAARRARERMGVGGGLLERQLQRGAIERERLGVGGMRPAGAARRLLVQRSRGPRLDHAHREHHRRPERLLRVSRCPYAHTLTLYVFTSGVQGARNPLVVSFGGFRRACRGDRIGMRTSLLPSLNAAPRLTAHSGESDHRFR